MHSEKSLISVFQDFSATINKAFILVGVLGTGLSFMKFRQLPDIS